MTLRIPSHGSYALSRARVHTSLTPGFRADFDRDGFALADIAVSDGRIASVSPASEPGPVDLAGRIVLPCFVDCHTHLDKGHIWPRAPNPLGNFTGALQSADVDRRARWSAVDVARRMDFALRSAYAYGTKALRTHLDSDRPQDAISWPVFEEMRERWSGRIELQASCLLGIEGVRDSDWFAALAKRVAKTRGILGAVVYMVPDIDALLERMFRLAMDHGLDLDFHADETGDASSVGLRKIGETARRLGFDGRILVGHCCSLARQPDEEVLRTLDIVADANVGVVSLPMCNLYLQDRRDDGTTPRWRGITLLHELKARGVPVAVASDNTRDPFYAYGDLDMLEVYRTATRIAHLDHPVRDWPTAMAAAPAEMMRLPEAGVLKAGGPADFVIFRGRSWTELLSRPESQRIVVRDGRAIDATVPDYDELDDLMGAV